MARRYFNWKLASVCVIGLTVLAITAYGLRQWQRSRRAEQGLELGNKAYQEHKWEEAARNLGRYLAVTKDDVPTLLKYADAQLNIRPLKQGNVRLAIDAYRIILRIDKNNSEAAVRLSGLYLDMGMPGEADLIAARAIETNPSAELQRILAIALARQRKFKEATEKLEAIIEEHPDQISAYEILGQLVEQRPEDFSQEPQFWFNEAVGNNPSSALAYIIRADFYLRTNNKTRAITDLEQAEKQDLSDPLVRLRLAREFINADVPDRVKAHLVAVQEAAPCEPDPLAGMGPVCIEDRFKRKNAGNRRRRLKELSSQPWDFMPTAVELYIRADELDRAADCISKLHQKDIAPANTAFLKGLVAEKKGHGHEAIKFWNQAIQMGDKSGRTRLALAITLSLMGDTQSSIRQLRSLVSEQPNSFRGRIQLAKLLGEAGNWAEAAEQAHIAGQTSPESLDASLLYIQARMHLLPQGRADEDTSMWQYIEDRLARLESATNGSLDVRFLQIQAATQRGDFIRAEELIVGLKKAHPSKIEISMTEANLLIAQDKIEKAISILKNVVEQFPENPEPVRYLAILLDRQDNRENCEEVIRDAIIRIERPVAHRNLGLLLTGLYMQWGQKDNAYSFLCELCEKLPDDIPVKLQLLECEQVSSDPEKGQRLVEEIKSLEGENGWQWRCQQARIWFLQENFEDSYPQIVSLLKENLLGNPDDQTSRMLLARSYERAGELQLAISTYTEALNRSPRDIRIIVPTVSALYRASKYDRADEILRRAESEKLFHPQLKRLELQSYLRRGELSSAGDILTKMLNDDPKNASVCLSLALLRMRQSRFAEADELLEKLKSQEPDSLTIAVAQIESYIRQKKSAEALHLCDEIVNKRNDAPAYILRGRTFTYLGQSEKAEKDFEHATIIEPNNTEAWVAKSNFYRSLNQFDKAVSSIRKAISLEPESVSIIKSAIPLLLVSSDYDTVRQGRNMLDKALASNPEDIELCLYKARSLLAEKTVSAAKQATGILRKITKEKPVIVDAWIFLAEIALQQERSAEALDTVLQGLVYRPNNKSLLMLKARAEAARLPAMAILTLKALREIDPNDTDVALYLAETYLAANQSQEAIHLLKAQLACCNTAPEKRKVNIALATALYKNGDKENALKELDLLQQSEPDDPVPVLVQAQLLKADRLYDQLSRIVFDWCQKYPEDTHTPVTIAWDLGKSKDAQAKITAENIFRMVLKNNSDCTDAISNLAMLLQITDRAAEAILLYQKLLELEPDDVVSINNLAWLLCEEQGKYQEALELAQSGIKKTPDYTDLIDTRGVVYYRLGELEKAVHDFRQCISLYTSNTPSLSASYFHLGRALAKLEQKDEAVDNLKKALELNNKIGGLSVTDLAEIQRLFRELSIEGEGQ